MNISLISESLGMSRPKLYKTYMHRDLTKEKEQQRFQQAIEDVLQEKPGQYLLLDRIVYPRKDVYHGDLKSAHELSSQIAEILVRLGGGVHIQVQAQSEGQPAKGQKPGQ